MNPQASLFDDLQTTPVPVRRLPPSCRTPYAKGSDTSKAAATTAQLWASHACERLYAFLVRCGECGATDKEIERALQMPRATICARRKGLAGRIEDSGQRRDGCAAWRVRGL